MMSGLIGGTAVIVFLCRLSGFAFTRLASSKLLAQFLHFVPIAIFSALIVPSVLREPDLLTSKAIGLAIAGILIWRTRQFGIGVVVGFAVFWLMVWAS